jgi:hypothetical protein
VSASREIFSNIWYKYSEFLPRIFYVLKRNKKLKCVSLSFIQEKYSKESCYYEIEVFERNNPGYKHLVSRVQLGLLINFYFPLLWRPGGGNKKWLPPFFIILKEGRKGACWVITVNLNMRVSPWCYHCDGQVLWTQAFWFSWDICIGQIEALMGLRNWHIAIE